MAIWPVGSSDHQWMRSRNLPREFAPLSFDVCWLMQVGFATSLGLLERNNADVEKFMELLRESKLYAPTFDKKLPRMLDRDFTNPNFPTKVGFVLVVDKVSKSQPGHDHLQQSSSL